TARDRRYFMAVSRVAKKFPVVGVYDDDEPSNRRMRAKGVQRMRDHRASADLAILLRAFGLAGSFASACRHDDHGRLFVCCHCRTLLDRTYSGGLTVTEREGQRFPKYAFMWVYRVAR